MPPSVDVDDDVNARVPLSRRRVVRAAVALADGEGIGAVTMRRLAQELEVEAMSLYHHVANKEAVLDGAMELVAEEILDAVGGVTGPAAEDDWKGALRARILSARAVLLRHPWSPQVLETRSTLSPPIIAYYDGLLGILRAGGFSWDLAHHAMHALGSRALGFTREVFEPDDSADGGAEAAAVFARMADRLPNITAMMAAVAHQDPDSTLGWCDDRYEFEFALDLLLDGLDRARAVP